MMTSTRRLLAATAVVASLLAVPANAASPPLSTGTYDLTSGSWASGISVDLIAGVRYDIGISWSAILDNYAASNFGMVVAQGSSFLYNIFNIGSTNGNGAGAGTSFIAPSTGTYQLWLTAAGVSGGGPFGGGAYTVQNLEGTIAVTAVPGPVAAAGLPAALAALFGFGLYRRRQQAG